MRFLKIFAGVVIFLLAVVAGLVFYAERLDWNAMKPEAEKRISDAAGRKFEITGDLDFTFFPMPRVSASGLRFANAGWGSEPLMLTAKSVTFVMEPLTLLTGFPLTRSITLSGVDLLLERNKEGQDNWRLGSEASGAGDQTRVFTRLRSVTADNITVIYKSPGNKPMRFEVNTAKLGARAIGGGLGLDINGTLNDTAFTVTGDLSPHTELLAGRRLQGKIDVQAPDFQAALNGDFGRLPDLVGSDFSVRGHGDTIPRLKAFEELPENFRGKWQANLKFAAEKDSYRISDADIQLADYRFQGDLSHDEAQGYSGDLNIEAPDYKLHADGQFGSLNGTDGIDANLSGSGTGLPAVPALASLQKYLNDEWQLTSHVKTAGDRVELDGLKLKLNQSDVSGTLSLDRSGPRPRVEGKLTSDLLDISLALKGDDKGSAGDRPAEGNDSKVFSDQPIALDWARTTDGSLEIAAKRLKATLFTYTDTLLRANLDHGKVTLESERGTIYGAEATGGIQLDASTEPAQISMEVSARGADVGKITDDWSDPPFMTGQGDIEVKITAVGNTPAALAGSVSGEARIVVGKGQAEVGVLQRMVKTVGLKSIGALLGEDKVETVPMTCFAANLSADAGLVKADVLVLDAEHATIFGSGSVDLGKEEYDLVFRPKPKSVTLNTAVPVRLGGTFQDPTVSAEKVGALRKIAGIASLFVFPPAAVAGLVDFGAGDNQCVKLAAKSK